MKRVAMILIALFAIRAHADVAYQMPKLFPESCGGVQYAYSSDRVYERTQCSTGGRGTKPLQVVACAEVAWNPDGSIASTETLWIVNAVGTQYPHVEACL